MEQGIHCLDLFRWFAGDFTEVACFVEAKVFKMSQLEDNAFVLLRNANGTVASLHASLTQWKNLFSFEFFGDRGYATVEGLGGSYGNERLTVGKIIHTGPFVSECTEFRGANISWSEEWKEFRSAIAEKRRPLGDGLDALEAMRLVFAAYEASTKRTVVTLSPRN
jgi:predicted dehydrogenase